MTVARARFLLRHPARSHEVEGQSLELVGYVIGTNLLEAPPCSFHARGVSDPEGCPLVALPAFWLADSATTPLLESTRVVGWASNYAQIHDAAKTTTDVFDSNWRRPLPRPLPAPGAKVKVLGRFGSSIRTETGVESDSYGGIILSSSVETLERAPTPEAIPSTSP